MENKHKARTEDRARFCVLSTCTVLPHLHMLTNLQALSTPSFRVFMGLHHIGRHDPWPLATDSTFSPSPLPTGQEVGLRFHLYSHMVSSTGNQPPSLGEFQESSLTEWQALHPSYYLGDSKDLGALCQTRKEDQNTFLTINHNNTASLWKDEVHTYFGYFSSTLLFWNVWIVCTAIRQAYSAFGIFF